jgi:hypothetical protein
MPAPTTCPPLRKDATPKDLLGFLARHGHTGRLTLIFAPGLGLIRNPPDPFPQHPPGHQWKRVWLRIRPGWVCR